jgi:hypothetical protein
VIRKDDELLLPPFLRAYEGGILNVVSETIKDQKNKRSAHPGEWLDYGDSLSMPDRMGVYVQLNEGLQWVAGGVFEGKVLGGTWTPGQPAYEMTMNRGWMKVWSKPSSYSGSLQIKTPKATLMVSEGVFWVSVTPQKTDLYVLSGSVKVGELKANMGSYHQWAGAEPSLQKSSTSWDGKGLESQILALYPNLVKLSHRANEEWIDGVSTKKYAELRSQGWKKSDRYFPSPTPQK